MAFPKKLIANTAAAAGGGALGIPFQYTMPAGFRAAGEGGLTIKNDGAYHNSLTYTGVSTYGERFTWSYNNSFSFCSGGRGLYGPSCRTLKTEKIYWEYYIEYIENSQYYWVGFSDSPTYSLNQTSYPPNMWMYRAAGGVVGSNENGCITSGNWASYSAGDVISVVFDGSTLHFYKNGSVSSSGYSVISGTYSRLYDTPNCIWGKHAGTIQVNLQGA